MPEGHIERVCEHVGVLRLGGAYGEPFRFVAVLVFDAPETVTVKGLAGTLRPSEWRAAVEIGHAEGIRRFRFERHRHGTVEEHAWDVTD